MLSYRLLALIVFASECVHPQQSDNKQKLSAIIGAMGSQEKAAEALRRAESLYCKFKDGSFTSWTKGKPVVELGVMTESGDPTVFYSIDLKAGTAKMMGNMGSSSISVILTSSGATFIEPTSSGNMNITTVFAGFVGTPKRFFAVHSRHFFAYGQARPSQYHGICTVPDKMPWDHAKDNEQLRGTDVSGSDTGGDIGTGSGGGIGGGVFRIGGGVSPPRLTYKVEPEYSEEARKAKYQGTVVLAIEVWQDGRAHNIRVIRSLGLGLDKRAIQAVQKWKFVPGKKGSVPVKVRANVEVNFRLLDDSPASLAPASRRRSSRTP